MQYEKVKPYLKWTIYYLLLLLFYSLQTTPLLFEIFSLKPILILPLIVSVCMFEKVMPSVVFALFGGLIWDISSDKLLGFNAIIFVFCGMFISLLCIYYLHAKLLNVSVFCLVVLVVQGLLDFLFYYAIWGYENSSIILLHNILPTIAYTLVFVFPTFWLVRNISNRFNDTTRM